MLHGGWIELMANRGTADGVGPVWMPRSTWSEDPPLVAIVGDEGLAKKRYRIVHTDIDELTLSASASFMHGGQHAKRK